ncbi:MAG: hypothetical protein NC930_07570 [Candidatus Omnitrophica bacterium]|nr:hypothetical protein [Candidatus Omnitrophota bacterium]
MKVKTVAYCFGVLLTVSALALVIEHIAGVLTDMRSSSIHQILPVTSLPLLKRIKSSAGLKQDLPSGRGPNLKMQVTLHLKSGGEVTGVLLFQDEDWVTLNVDGSEAGFHRSEINRITPLE